MFQKTVFETAKEFLDAVQGGQIPPEVYLVFSGHDVVCLSGEGSQLFELSEDVSAGQMIQALAQRAGTSART
jgi:hypothetical protein